MRNLIKLLFFFIGTVLSLTVSASITSASDSETLKVDMALHDITRVHIVGDRILSVYGQEGRYTLQADNVQGDVYLQPVAESRTDTFTFYLATENGQSYTVIATLKDMPAKPLIIKPSGYLPLAKSMEESTPYEKSVTNLMKAMIADDIIPGLSRIAEPTQIQKEPHGLEMMLKARWVSHFLKGEVFNIKNPTSQSITLHESWFVTPNAKAVALERVTLAPFSHALVYRITS